MQTGIVAPFLLEPQQLSETGVFPADPLEASRSVAKSLAATVDVALALVRAGRKLDLVGLDSQVGLLCAKALDLEPEDGRAVRQELIALRSALDNLGTMLGLPTPP